LHNLRPIRRIRNDEFPLIRVFNSQKNLSRAIDDEAAGRSVVMAQIVGLEIEVHEGERRLRHLVPVPGELKPFVFQRDERPANAFEIMGLKVGLDPQDFIRIANARFGATTAYDPATRSLRTAGTDCAAWPATGLNQQPCVAADFDVTGHGWFGGETIGLTRLSISQNVDYDQLDGSSPDLSSSLANRECVRSQEIRRC
jgi:hypothetical protein